MIGSNDRVTLHYYSGSDRIVSRLAGASDIYNESGLELTGNNSGSLPTRQLADLQYVFTAFDLGTVDTENQPPVDGDCEAELNCPSELYFFHPDHIGSSTFLTDETGNPYQFLLYLPFGESMAEQKAGGYSTKYRFSGKEVDEETGLYYFGARYYDPRISLWYGVDPLANKYSNWNPYNYTLNNPINLIDENGLYPKPLLIFNSNIGFYGGYKFTKSATHLLSLVSGVDKGAISNVIIQKRAPGQYRPFYSAVEGGGAITLGTTSYNANITYTENYFEDDASKYEGHGYGQDIYEWLDLSSHEVGHLPQIDKEGGFFGYVSEFINQYSKAGHDGAKYEKEADKGQNRFNDFNNFLNEKYGDNTLINILSATIEINGHKGTEDYKIRQIDKLWNEFINSEKE